MSTELTDAGEGDGRNQEGCELVEGEGWEMGQFSTALTSPSACFTAGPGQPHSRVEQRNAGVAEVSEAGGRQRRLSGLQAQ